MTQGSQNQAKRKYISVSSRNQPYPQCTFPENVHNSLLHIPAKVHEEFGSHSSVSVRTPRNYFSAIIYSRRLSPYLWLVVALCTPQLRVKYLCTSSHHGAHFVIYVHSFIAGVQYEVLFTIFTTQTLFCGNLALLDVAMVNMASYDNLNTSKERTFQHLSNGAKIILMCICV